jgi:hypothetical protein
MNDLLLNTLVVAWQAEELHDIRIQVPSGVQ